MAQTLAQLRVAVRRNLREVERFATPLSGTFTVAAGSAAVTGTGSALTSECDVGDEIRLGDEIRQIVDLASDTALTVNAPFVVIHTTAAGNLLGRRTWTDEEVTDEINGALQAMHTLLLADAPAVLATRVTGNLPASKSVTLPTTLATVETIEVLAQAGTELWAVLQGPVPLAALSASGPLPWWIGQVGLVAAPTAYAWVGPATIELNSTPPAAITNGVRWTGAGAFTPLTTEAGTIGWADPSAWEAAAIALATGELLQRSRTAADRSAYYLANGQREYERNAKRWTRGRQQGAYSVQLVR